MRGSGRSTLVGTTAGFFVGLGAVSLFGSGIRTFNSLLYLSPLEMGILVAIPSLTGSLARIPFGAWVDGTGGRKPFAIQLGLAIAGMSGLLGTTAILHPIFLTLGSSIYYLLLLFGALAGFGASTFSSGVGQVSYWFRQNRQGRALSIFAGLGNTGPGVSALILPAVLVVFGLTFAYSVWLAILVAGTLVYLALAWNAWYFQLVSEGKRDELARAQASSMGQELFPGGNAADSLLRAAAHPRTWALVVIYYLSFGGFLALTAWLPVYWEFSMGEGIVAAGVFTATYSIVCSLMRVGGGLLSDRIGGERTLFIGLFITLAGGFGMLLSGSIPQSVAGVLLLGTGMGITNAAVFKLVPTYLPKSVGGASGIVGGFGASGGFILPIILGIYVVHFGAAGYRLGFSVFVALALLSLNIALILRLKGNTHSMNRINSSG